MHKILNQACHNHIRHAEAYSEPHQSPKTKHFAIIINGYYSATISRRAPSQTSHRTLNTSLGTHTLHLVTTKLNKN